MDDTTKPHRARVETYYLRDESITTLQWPARSLTQVQIRRLVGSMRRRLATVIRVNESYTNY
jgi:hypothetical protein